MRCVTGQLPVSLQAAEATHTTHLLRENKRGPVLCRVSGEGKKGWGVCTCTVPAAISRGTMLQRRVAWTSEEVQELLGSHDRAGTSQLVEAVSIGNQSVRWGGEGGRECGGLHGGGHVVGSGKQPATIRPLAPTNRPCTTTATHP